MKQIKQQIKSLFGTEEAFCAYMYFKYKNFASKKRTVLGRINWLNEFLKPLNLAVKIVDLNKT